MNVRTASLALLLALGSAACAGEVVRSSGSGPGPDPAPVAAARPRLELVRIEARQDESERAMDATLRLVNDTDRAILFWGYGPDQPVSTLQIWRDGEWQRERFAWCGTGLGEHALPPGASIELLVPSVDSLGVWRVGVDYRWDGDDGVEAGSTAWCERVDGDGGDE